MPRPLLPVHLRVNRPILLALALFLCSPLFAIDVDPRLDKAIRANLPVCSTDATITYEAPNFTLPQGFKAVNVKIASARPTCTGQFMAVQSSAGGFFLGSPWPISNEEGTTIEEKLRSFTARNMRESMDVKVTRTNTEDGLWPVTLTQTLEAGKLPLSGYVDPQGRVFFFGSFRRLGGDLLAQRAKAFDAYVPDAPAKGKGNITILEFSDFQCPSCRHAAGYADAVLAKYGDRVRYVRYDLPLSVHPWAFPAALAGRAVYRQKPELFWEYKKTVYANQETLSAFTFWDWARAWAEDHDLDLAKYDADLNNAAIKTQILTGSGIAFSNDVRATPTYMVNGVIVDPGEDGKALVAYVEKLVGAK
ncbi:MAG TPA: thioredoxin domain-containing protein [Thermoanaerobaculia bacterium]|jgi:protein-disulfide isomerase|nr:thioredoxin domain-containing protein [Thermoanaerobaculia bacterium]